MNTPRIENLVDRYLAACCDPDAARRLAAVREIWSAEGKLRVLGFFGPL